MTGRPLHVVPADQSKGSAVTVRHLSKTYGDGHSAVQALDDVTLDIRKGEFVCLLGASGCGKSTLLNLIAGIYHVDQGAIETKGRVGLMFQEPALFPWMTVEKNVESSMRFRRVPQDRRRARTYELLRMVHLDDFASRRPHQLSGGMQQRAALAHALAQDADILLMDEPFGALDAMTRAVLHDELEGIWSGTGLTVAFVTHDVREAVRLGDRIVLLSSRPGRVIEEFEVDLPRPRDVDSPEGSRIVSRVISRLRAEVRRHGQ